MAAVKILTAVVFVALGVTAVPYNIEGATCELSGVDLDDEVDRLLEKLPKAHYPQGQHDFQPAFAGFEVSNVIVTGLNKIKRFGPAIAYCKKGTSMIQVDLINMGDVEFTVPWRTCSGEEGKAILSAEYSRFTAQLRVEKEGNSGTYLAVNDDNPTLPVNTYNIRLVVEGMGDGGSIVSRALSKFFPSLALELWTEAFFGMFKGALRSAVKTGNEVF